MWTSFKIKKCEQYQNNAVCIGIGGGGGTNAQT